MLNKTMTIASLLVASAAAPALADVSFHITGSSWGAWLIFNTASDFGPTNHYSFMDMGSGNPMDFMMTTPDGALLDGGVVDSRMVSADFNGSVGDPEVELSSLSLWIGAGGISVHLIWDLSASPLALTNLGSSGEDGVSYGAFGLSETLDWTYERADGTVEFFQTDVQSFEFTAPIPAPGALALLGMGGLAVARRRR
jgi:MYXO-CTERM domain-containing protein